MVVRTQTDEMSDTLNFAESLAPAKEEGKAQSAKAKLSPWLVEIQIPDVELEKVLLNLDREGYFIYKVIFVPTAGFTVIAKPKNYINQASGIRKQLESISKSFAAMLALDKEALATARKE